MRRVAAMLAAAAFLLPHSAPADEWAASPANDALQRRVDQLAQFSVPLPEAAHFSGQPGVFPRSFLVLGTDTSMRIGGYIREDLDYWLLGGPPNVSPQTTNLGNTGQAQFVALNLHGQVVRGVTQNPSPAYARGKNVFSQSPQVSRLVLETRTPTAWGELRTVAGLDWAGSTAYVPGGNVTSVSNDLVPRLLTAYASLDRFLAGQSFSNFFDIEGVPETLERGGDLGESGPVRTPQIRYTLPLAGAGLAGSLSLSIETPEPMPSQPPAG